jgi:hypothetical protein
VEEAARSVTHAGSSRSDCNHLALPSRSRACPVHTGTGIHIGRPGGTTLLLQPGRAAA